MAFEILVPEINNKPANTKDAVISVLTTDWPLNLRSIFYILKKQYRYSFTYQSVYKAVKELCEKKVLIEKNKKYEINISWVKRLQSFTDIVETNYYTTQRFQNQKGLKDSKSEKDLMVLTFETIFDAEKYLYYFMKNELLKRKNEIICFQLNNEWRPLFYLRSEYNYYKKLMQKGNKFYFICAGSSYLEELCKKFYKSIGVNVKTIKHINPSDNIIFGDCLIQIFIPEELKIKMNEFLEKKDIINLLKNVLEKKSSIKVIINKDLSLVNEIKKQIIKRF